jgi:hypothetical protein
LFRVGGFVLSGETIVTDLHSSLGDTEHGRMIQEKGDRESERERERLVRREEDMLVKRWVQ